MGWFLPALGVAGGLFLGNEANKAQKQAINDAAYHQANAVEDAFGREQKFIDVLNSATTSNTNFNEATLNNQRHQSLNNLRNQRELYNPYIATGDRALKLQKDILGIGSGGYSAQQ